MSDTVGQPPPKIALRSKIDRLSASLVPGAEISRCEQQLQQLSRRAPETGFLETSSLAVQLADDMRSEPANGVHHEHILRQGLILLHDVLSSEPGKAVKNENAAASEAQARSCFAQDAELVSDFVLESREHLSSIEGLMLELEQNPGVTDAIHSVFRAFHTIKGLASFLEFAAIQEVSHEVETLLDLARNGKLSIDAEIADVVLQSTDYLKQCIDAVEAELAGSAARPIRRNKELILRIRKAASIDGVIGAPALVQGFAHAGSAPPQKQHVSTKWGKAASFSVRVETQKLDSLMDMVGEMVIAQSLVRHNPSLAAIQDARLAADLSHLARITAEIQRTTIGMRMIPIGQLFQRTARMVRDLARKAGKTVQLETGGEDTEVDRNIAEELSDPLLHMVRNSLDHGIELPGEREAAAKPATARIRLAAYHEAGQIVLEISDDGRGLNKAKILEKARQRGLVQEGTQLSENEIYQLIFEPGFSTAENITDISGRGVGMDVVRKNVQKLRGRIDVQSSPGAGAKFLLSLPVTLAIIDGFVVAVGEHRYIVPIFEVREMIRPTPETISSVQGRDEVALVRGRVLPLVRLYQRFGVTPRSQEICDGLLVVAESEGEQFCVLVDELLGKQKVVFKSLGEKLKNMKGIAGCAILRDGRVGLILDLQGVLRGNR